jgi:hypothetical protein
MALADKTVMAMTTRALALALGLVLITIPAWGQAGETANRRPSTGFV